MKKVIIGLFGVGLLLFSLLLMRELQKGSQLARRIDNEKTVNGVVDGPASCEWDLDGLERIMSENASQVILIDVSNPLDEPCEVALLFRAPGFDVSPNKEEQKISLRQGEDGSLSWIISPRKTGTFEVTLTDMIRTRVLGISVTNVLGLSAVQAKFISVIGSVCGPMFTIPWWWDRMRQRKEKKIV